MSSCAVTGHRVLGKNFSAERLEEALRSLCAEGCDTFYCGMALGFDTVCGEALLRLKGEYPVRLVACIPCADQSERFSAAQRARYDALLSACDERVVLHERYENGCMFERNRYMVDRCDVLLAYLESGCGGTLYTVNYARKKGKRVLFV